MDEYSRGAIALRIRACRAVIAQQFLSYLWMLISRFDLGMKDAILSAWGKNVSKIVLGLIFICSFGVLGYAADAVFPTAQTEPGMLDKIFSPQAVDEDGKLKIKVGMESRYRLELRDDFNFKNQSYEDDALNLLRNRINLDTIYQPEKDGGKIRVLVEAVEK